MYFYEICAYDYDESCSTIFMSSKHYTEHEFKDIIFKCYELACYDIIENDPDSLCWDRIFGADYVIVLNKRFDEIIAREYGLHSINGEISEKVFFDLSFHNCTEKNNRRLTEVFDNLDLDESCWKDCWRLSENAKRWNLKNNCAVAKRRVKRD